MCNRSGYGRSKPYLSSKDGRSGFLGFRAVLSLGSVILLKLARTCFCDFFDLVTCCAVFKVLLIDSSAGPRKDTGQCPSDVTAMTHFK
ncbi:hypothetical protein SAMN02745225_00433 [Ferrithrix thermotolerans DSM 19514]|uniref:Uncharacterized protein n=1 Tax=Ferrithrix thermotolerans DSM 19514 TaxID=1121881 RepID=A0A1M4SXN9_9ACTN|nr:hypothetical protein SAMN02745225_00433 [Ferrithrix thermotolerans DSM 19514]